MRNTDIHRYERVLVTLYKHVTYMNATAIVLTTMIKKNDESGNYNKKRLHS